MTPGHPRHARRARGISRASHGARLEGAASRARGRAPRGVGAHGRHALVPDRRGDRRARVGDPARRRARSRVTAAHVEGTGVRYDPELSRAVKEAKQPIAYVAGNVALLIHTRGASEEEAYEYSMRWGLSSPRRAKQSVRFVTDPVWRSYITTYTDGYELCRKWVDGDPARFKRLLTEQLTPADLARYSETAVSDEFRELASLRLEGVSNPTEGTRWRWRRSISSSGETDESAVEDARVPVSSRAAWIQARRSEARHERLRPASGRGDRPVPLRMDRRGVADRSRRPGDGSHARRRACGRPR